MFLPLLVWGPWQSDCAAVFLADVLVRAPQANPQLIMIHLQGNGFLFAALRLGISEFLICKSVANLNEGKGARLRLGYMVGIPLEVAMSL